MSSAFGLLRGSRALFAASKSAASKSASTPRKVSPALTKEIPISADLQVIVGVQQISRGQASKKLWEYIKAHNLQNPSNKREILCDAKLKKVFDGRDKVGFLEIGKLMSPHFLKTTT